MILNCFLSLEALLAIRAVELLRGSFGVRSSLLLAFIFFGGSHHFAQVLRGFSVVMELLLRLVDCLADLTLENLWRICCRSLLKFLRFVVGLRQRVLA